MIDFFEGLFIVGFLNSFFNTFNYNKLKYLHESSRDTPFRSTK
jgi:hypothetical protein